MKTIKQLEKEIEEFIRVSDINNPSEEDLFPVLNDLKATLTQTKEIIKLIGGIFKKKEWLWIGEDDEINWDKSIFELEDKLLTKLRGEK